MGRSILNSYQDVQTNVLGFFYQQQSGGFFKSGNHNGSFGAVSPYAGGTNHMQAIAGTTGYTVKKTGSFFHIRFAVSQDHGTTWRASVMRLLGSDDNWSSQKVLGAFGMTSYDSDAHTGSSGLYERIYQHGTSAGTVWRFGFQDSGNSSGNTHAYNNFNFGEDSGSNINQGFGDCFGFYLRIQEIDTSAVYSMSPQNTFAAN